MKLKDVFEGKDYIDDAIYGIPHEDDIKKMEKPTGEFSLFKTEEYFNQPPPKNSSTETVQELFELDKMHLDVQFVIDADNIPQYFLTRTSDLNLGIKLGDFIKAVVDKTAPIILKIKYHYNRPRPVQVAKLHGLKFHDQPLKSAKTPSYPSGHTTQAYLLAYMLSDIYNKHTDRFFEIAEEISKSRNIARQHFLSDSEFGKKIAKDMWRYYETK